jgi:membrane fusion protein (multidrug efflux system)
MKRFILIFTILALAACAKREPAAAAAKDAPLPEDVQKVQGAVTATATTASTDSTGTASAAVADDRNSAIVATGELISPVRSELSVKMPGRVGKMYVDEGVRVSRGQPLLELESDYVRLNAERADADVARAKAAEEDAHRDLDRKKELIAKDSIPKATYDRSESMYMQAQAARQSAVAQASLLRQQVSDAVLRSPIDGVVAEKRTDVGQRLGDNTVALVIVQTSPLKLRFRIPERYIATVRKGQSVKATVDPYPNETFEGRVTVVGGVIDPATRSFTVETEFANRDGHLRPGMFARVEMEPSK